MNKVWGIGFLVLAICFSGCIPQYYNQTERDYDYDTAKTTISELKEGLLLVSLPTDYKKIDLLETVHVKNPANTNKKEELDKAKAVAREIREEFAKYFKEYYSFSDYKIVDDTLLKPFLRGETVVIKEDISVAGETSLTRDSNQSLFICRTNRDVNDLRVVNADGTMIPSPFPMTSQTGTKYLNVGPWDEMSEIRKSSEIGLSIYILNGKFDHFYRKG